ncbi:hypothetical protein MLD38_012978 [Melastoma candidum]|uniref:Uncharacterized protein n=1 Tax=Melastoma candidum TaxID=119954 RepID=A0ACB9RB78_9MYRT|nr:hypothetical protein MLD38_012978 [Melastoma candidum]
MSTPIHLLVPLLVLFAVAATMIRPSCLLQPTNLHPLIVVPGAGGNQLDARLTRDYRPTGLLCNRGYPVVKDKDGWFRLWFDPGLVLLRSLTQCFAERMTLHYDEASDDYYNAPGVETRVNGFGSTESMLYLDPNLKRVTTYMADLVDHLKRHGYVDGKTLFGAPYDFRYGLAAEGHPSQVGSKFLQDLKDLIEKASASNHGKPVILISHSLGGLFVLQLLNRNSPSWRCKYVKHFIALSAPWGGAVDEMLTFASGNTLGVPLVDPLIVRSEQRSSESNLWLLPNPKVFGGRKVLVVNPKRNYTALDMVSFLEDIGFPVGVHPYRSRISPLIAKLVAPEVPVTCIVGSGIKTADALFYNNKGFDEAPEIVYGDGDGTVNMVSLLALEPLWKGNENQPLKVIVLRGVTHTSILKDGNALEEITRQVLDINAETRAKIL